jgi:hypothetical protein
MKIGAVGMALGLALGGMAAGLAQASPPAEKISCTQAPRSAWLPEARIREIFGEKDFTVVKLKVSRGNCYEFYAVHHDGSVVEAYYQPVSGKVVRYNRVTIKAATPGYESFSSPATR